MGGYVRYRTPQGSQACKNPLIYSRIELWHQLCTIYDMETTVFYYILFIYVDSGEEEAV